MNKYGPKAAKEIAKTMHEFHEGKLKSGRGKQPVSSQDQAVAIGIAKARAKQYKVPKESHPKSTR
ncbi:MAG: DUF6496 domain-containing protein [Candidatus Saccharibacteria bacterium]|nr:DUF6496 domain-containing protein [Candidatus Saccharibacteria bacterium]